MAHRQIELMLPSCPVDNTYMETAFGILFLVVMVAIPIGATIYMAVFGSKEYPYIHRFPPHYPGQRHVGGYMAGKLVDPGLHSDGEEQEPEAG